MSEFIYRLAVGGLVVSVFAFLGDACKPKTFAGLFSAAPSVALATIALTVATKGKVFASIEARSMIAGAIAFLVYAWCTCQCMMRYRMRASVAATGCIAIWGATAFGLYFVALR